MGDLPGYRGASLKMLSQHDVSVGDVMLVKAKGGEFKGSLLPRYEYADDKHIVLKLDNGYNVGIEVSNIQSITKIAAGQKPSFTPLPLPKIDAFLPKASILGTGGTIASRIDYRTGAVHPAFSAEELYSVIPELAKCAQIETEAVFNIYSENMTPSNWTKLAEACAKKAASVDGIVIGHGTDTMAYTAAALSFALHGIGIPVVLVGSQRSTDRPSSDAAINMISAVTFAVRAPASGVYVAMHASTDDDSVAIHLGTKVRKNHTSRRDAFESVNVSPVAHVKDQKIELKTKLPGRKNSAKFEARTKFEEKVALVKFYPGFDPLLIDALVKIGYKGIVLEGTGLGHVSTKCYDAIQKATSNGVLIAMTSQCIWGRVRMTVYSTGRELLNLGVIPLADMLPETALVKMMWVLANFKHDEQKSMLRRNISGEINERSPLVRRPA